MCAPLEGTSDGHASLGLHASCQILWRSPVLARMHLSRSCLPRLGQKRLEPTWHLAPGECRDSLALEVAANCRLPEGIIQRASEHYQVSALLDWELTSHGQVSIQARGPVTFAPTALL